jgi:hypothetical protein
VKWIGFSDPWSGIAQVFLDGKLVATVDTYSATQVAQKVQYTASGLTDGPHTLTIVVSGSHDTRSAGAWVWVDAFDVTVPAANPATPLAGAAVANSLRK